MKKRTTYRKSIDSNNIIRVEEFDGDKKLIKDTLYEKGNKISEITVVYDKSGNISSETDTNEDGITTTRYEYSADNKIISHRQFFNEELYEDVRYLHNNNIMTIETYQDDELVSRLVKTVNEDKTGSQEYYDMDGKLSEKQVVLFDAKENAFITEVYNEDNTLVTKILERSNGNNNPKEVIYLNDEGKLFKHQILSYENDRITEIQSTDYYADIAETTCKNEYNEKGFLITQQLFNANDDLIQDCHTHYNEQGDIIEDVSHYTGGQHSAAGILNGGRSYHLLYEIEY